MIKVNRRFDKIYVVADPHFCKNLDNSVEVFLDFIDNLPKKNCCLVLLGDLFEIWSMFDVEFDQTEKKVLKAILTYRQRGGFVVFLAGNRDLFFKDKKAHKASRYEASNYFDVVGEKFVTCGVNNGSNILFHHGHRISYHLNDFIVKFLLLLVRLIALFSRRVAQKRIRAYYDKKYNYVSAVNQHFNFFYGLDQKLWLRWLELYSSKFNVDVVAIGHFHPKDLLTQKTQTKKIGLIVPSWMDGCNYLYIDKLGFNLLKYVS